MGKYATNNRSWQNDRLRVKDGCCGGLSCLTGWIYVHVLQLVHPRSCADTAAYLQAARVQKMRS